MWKTMAILGALLIVGTSGPRTAAAQGCSIFKFDGLVTVGCSDDPESVHVYEREFWASINTETGEFSPGGTHIVVWVHDRYGKTVGYEAFEKSGVTLIAIMANGGADYVSVSTDVDTIIDGGYGEDTLHGGEGDDLIDAGPLAEDDAVYGHGGQDTLVAGRIYNPIGDNWFFANSWTYLNGGPGLDTFIYNNADAIVLDDVTYLVAGPIPADLTYHKGPYANMDQYSE